MNTLVNRLESLRPWKKGPFHLGPYFVDAEWNADLKLTRLQSFFIYRKWNSVLDIGAHNGHTLLHLKRLGVKHLVGIEPTKRCLEQFSLISEFYDTRNIELLPLRESQLLLVPGTFELILSMGLLYHLPSLSLHLQNISAKLSPGGHLLIETICLPQSYEESIIGPITYAKMKKISIVPSLRDLTLHFEKENFIPVAAPIWGWEKQHEQRVTYWGPNASYADFLDPLDPGKTIEGYPSPERVAYLLQKKG